MEVLVIVPIILAFWLVAFIQRSFESKAALEKRAQQPKSALRDDCFSINPATGLPMLPGSVIDAGGNPLGKSGD